MTYDVEVRRGPEVPWRSILLLLAVLAVVAVLVGWMVSSRIAATAPPAAPAPAAGATTGTATATPPPAASGSPTTAPDGGSDAGSAAGSPAGEGLTAPEGSQLVAARFVQAWLDRNPTTRKAALSQLAAPALAEQLMLTDPANIPVARRSGAPVLADASTYSAQFTQALSTGGSIRVYLVADPQARYRWLATSVERA